MIFGGKQDADTVVWCLHLALCWFGCFAVQDGNNDTEGTEQGQCLIKSVFLPGKYIKKGGKIRTSDDIPVCGRNYRKQQPEAN